MMTGHNLKLDTEQQKLLDDTYKVIYPQRGKPYRPKPKPNTGK